MGLGEILIRYLLEAVKFSLGNEIFCKKRQNYAVLLLGAAACIPMWLLLREYMPFFRSFFVYLELLAFVFFSLRCPVRERCAAFLKLYLFVVVCDSLIDIPWELRGMGQMVEGKDALLTYVVQNLIIILLLCLIYIGRECLPESMQRAFGRFAERYLPAAGGGAVFLLLLLLTGLDIAISGTEDVYTRQILGIVREGGAVGAGLLGLLLSAVWASRERLLLIRQQQDRYLQKQQEYYELLLEKEQDTRAYRHDMQRHLLNLYALQKKEGKEEQVRKYLRGLVEGLEEIQKKVYVTGNDVIDVLTNAYLSGLDPSVKVEFHCQIQQQPQISDMDLCTVYGNLLENAVEELNRGGEPRTKGAEEKEGAEERGVSWDDRRETPHRGVLRIELTGGRFWFRIHMENSLAKPETKLQEAQSDGKRTWKSDEKNHGLGLSNVKSTVERLEGMYEAEKTKERYIVTVTLPNRTV